MRAGCTVHTTYFTESQPERTFTFRMTVPAFRYVLIVSHSTFLNRYSNSYRLVLPVHILKDDIVACVPVGIGRHAFLDTLELRRVIQTDPKLCILRIGGIIRINFSFAFCSFLFVVFQFSAKMLQYFYVQTLVGNKNVIVRALAGMYYFTLLVYSFSSNSYECICQRGNWIAGLHTSH